MLEMGYSETKRGRQLGEVQSSFHASDFCLRNTFDSQPLQLKLLRRTRKRPTGVTNRGMTEKEKKEKSFPSLFPMEQEIERRGDGRKWQVERFTWDRSPFWQLKRNLMELIPDVTNRAICQTNDRFNLCTYCYTWLGLCKAVNCFWRMKSFDGAFPE